MEGASGGIMPLLWVWFVVLLLFALDRLCAMQARRLRAFAPLLLLLGGLWLSSMLVDLVLRYQVAVSSWLPLQALDHALRLPTS
jgi:hypothetical protein